MRISAYSDEFILNFLKEYLESEEFSFNKFANKKGVGNVAYSFVRKAETLDTTLSTQVKNKMEYEQPRMNKKSIATKRIDFSEIAGKTFTRTQLIDWFLEQEASIKYSTLTCGDLFELAKNNDVNVLRKYA